ncbi:RND transporter [Flavobacterium akiainvivens]|uniref:RND transporter n=1 Tax=Flavobacterium akiainvivens TaxID=1202724 RepID=A0A0M9VHW0_9FLAO|nr:efflux RND transporter periplasmic adaptor subunit [Flavobacterium akiainvivens]KOS05732.1 RND transporter [Flavobacterium akiainvivens]SFQ37514.1 membrane fusion protein, multidrug efflux system [Flavobacterium akiainvivens]
MKPINQLLSVAVLALLYACSGNQNPATPTAQAVPVPVYNVTTHDAFTWQEYPVMLEGRTDVEIRPQVDGYLQSVFVDEGAFVKAGQSIFKIEDHRYREALNNATGSLNVAEAALINAKLEVEKLTPLVDGKVISEYQLKSAKAALKIAEGNKKQAEAAVASARINLEFTTIKAPVSGYITRLPKKQGSLVSAADPLPLTTLSDNAEVHAYFSVSEADFTKFRATYEGTTLNEKLSHLPALSLVLPDNTEYAQKGRIDMVDGQFNKTTGAITLRASFPNAQGLLRAGNTGKVKLGLPHAGAVLVPQASTVELQDKIFVYTVDKANKVAKTPITILGKSGNDYLVKDGVKAGDRIVYKGFEGLQDGVTVAPEKIKPEVASK